MPPGPMELHRFELKGNEVPFCLGESGKESIGERRTLPDTTQGSCKIALFGVVPKVNQKNEHGDL